MGIEGVRGQSTNHCKKCELPEMEDSFSRKTASHEQGHSSGSLVMEALEVLKNILVMFVKNTNLRLVQDKSSQASKQDWCLIEAVNTE